MPEAPPIALVELYGHCEVLYALCRCCQAASVRVVALTTGRAFSEAPAALTHGKSGITWHIQGGNQSVPDFLCTQEAAIRVCRVLVFTTLAGNFRFFSRKTWPVPAVLLIHDGYYWLKPFRAMRPRSIVDLGRLVKEWILLKPLFRQRILEKMDRVSFPSGEIRCFLISERLFPEAKCLPPLSFGVAEPEAWAPPPPHQGIVITIPGTITADIRDYPPLLEALRNIQPVLQREVSLVLLGKARKKREESMLDQFRALGQGLLSVVTFTETIPQDQYDYWLRVSDFLILPLRQDMYYGICQERGGLTKISGTVNDMIRFGIPALITSDYVVGKALEPAVCRYDNSETLARLLLDWINQRTFLDWRAKNQDMWKQFSPEVLGKELAFTLDQVSGQ